MLCTRGARFRFGVGFDVFDHRDALVVNHWFCLPMKLICSSVLIALTVSATPASAPTDAALDRALQGAWCNSEDAGRTCWGFDVFDDGMTRSCGQAPGTSIKFFSRTRYTVNGRRVCHRFIESSQPGTVKPGDTFCADVLEIDDKIQRFRLDGAAGDSWIYRVDRSAVRCPPR